MQMGGLQGTYIEYSFGHLEMEYVEITIAIAILQLRS